MGRSKMIVEELKLIIESKLKYKEIAKLSKEDYQQFIYNFFKMLDVYKKIGVIKSDINIFVNDILGTESEHFENNTINQDRLIIIIEEVISFCPSPLFWDIPLEEYMKKWERLYFPNL